MNLWRRPHRPEGAVLWSDTLLIGVLFGVLVVFTFFPTAWRVVKIIDLL
jgi:hypothetical protein